MKIIIKHFSALKLNHKFTLLIIGTIVIPMVILSLMLFQNMRASQIKEKMKSVELNFNQNYNQIQKNVQMCHMSTQVILNNLSLWQSIYTFSTEEVDIKELMYFNNNDIVGYERLVNTNPYLYQLRIYIESDRLQEMMPVLYRMDRLKRLSWAKDGDYQTGSWQFDYRDEIFPNFVLGATEHVASLVTLVNESDMGVNGVIEIATKMELLFPDIYTSTEEQWTCFVNQEGNYYYDQNSMNQWSKHLETVFNEIPKYTENDVYKQMKIDKEPVIVGYIPLKELNGHLLKIVSLRKSFSTINTYGLVFFICFFVAVVLLILFVEKIVHIILKQFYAIMDTIHQVQKGDMSIRIEDCKNNEVGELGGQINEMLDRITRLMEVNIKREVLAKDSEIRALQNQINAHFIYNVLESIKMMAEIDEKYEISNAVTALGKLLRYSMKWETENVTVEKEIDYIKNYLALINLRFDYEIFLSLNLQESILKQKIPKMSLQPIIENAIYHGIEEMAEDTNIYMKGIIYEDYFCIEITDAGKGMTVAQVEQIQKKIKGEIETTGGSGNGIGLKNVQDRLQLNFGEEFGISIMSKEGCYTKVILKIPLKIL